jgi:hypothetical protein
MFRRELGSMLERLKAFSPYAWLPILIVAVISATLAYKNLSLQQAGSRPEVIAENTSLTVTADTTGTLGFAILNVGTREALDYLITIKTVDMGTGRVVILKTVTYSNPIKRQGVVGEGVHLDLSEFLDVLAMCAAYRDDDGNPYSDAAFFNFPGMTKDKVNSGFGAASVPPDVRKKLDKMDVCKG